MRILKCQGDDIRWWNAKDVESNSEELKPPLPLPEIYFALPTKKKPIDIQL